MENNSNLMEYGETKCYRKQVNMRQKKYLIVLISFILQSCSSHKTEIPKSYTITGFVLEDNVFPLPGVTVKVQNLNSKETHTDFNGKFELNVNEGDVLIVEFIGYESTKIKITEEKIYRISLINKTHASYPPVLFKKE